MYRPNVADTAAGTAARPVEHCLARTEYRPVLLLHIAPKRIAAVFLSLGLATSVTNAGDLTVYSTTDADNLKVMGKAFSEAHPDVKVNWVRDSTGIMHARLMAEKDNPRAVDESSAATRARLSRESSGAAPSGSDDEACAAPWLRSAGCARG